MGLPSGERTRGRPQGTQQDGWRDQAACRAGVTAVSPEDWFLPNEAKALRAKAVCAGCPVREACLDYALRTQQPWGVWGGQTSEERGTAYQRTRIR